MKFELFKSAANGEWYWRLLASNGQVIAIGGEGYKNRIDALNSLNNVKMSAASAPVYEQLSTGQWQKL